MSTSILTWSIYEKVQKEHFSSKNISSMIDTSAAYANKKGWKNMSIINDKFMLKNETGKRLYEEFARDMPIYDYHCHLNPQMIAENTRFRNITDI